MVLSLNPDLAVVFLLLMSLTIVVLSDQVAQSTILEGLWVQIPDWLPVLPLLKSVLKIHVTVY